MRHLSLCRIVLITSLGISACGYAQQAIIPSGVSVSIIDSKTVPGIKRTLDIRLNKKVSRKTLRSIALELKARDGRHYQRTFMTYYLPGMTVGAGAWATTHFDPNLRVRILGTTERQEKELLAKSHHSASDTIGRWFDDRPYIAGPITIFQQGSKLFVEQAFKDGSTLKEQVTERHSSSDRRFDPVSPSGEGDYWLIAANGNLEIRDNEGLIATARKVP